MLKLRTLLVLIGAALFGSAVIAEQQSPAQAGAPQPTTSQRAAGQASTYRPVATVQEIMDAIISPASKAVFDAVSTEVTATGAVEKAPKNDEEWATVRNNALMMVEGANLLMLPGRHIARGPVDAKAAHEAGELTPPEIEARVAKDRATWNRLAAGFRNAAMVALKAAEARKPGDVQAAGEGVDGACENCHIRYWYPDQVKTLDRADQALRKRK